MPTSWESGREYLSDLWLNVSRKEQKKRFLERLERPEKNWKFFGADLAERGFWDDHIVAYEDAITATRADWAPWYIIPADHKWAIRALVAVIITRTLGDLDLKYPEVSDRQRAALAEARK